MRRIDRNIEKGDWLHGHDGEPHIYRVDSGCSGRYVALTQFVGGKPNPAHQSANHILDLMIEYRWRYATAAEIESCGASHEELARLIDLGRVSGIGEEVLA